MKIREIITQVTDFTSHVGTLRRGLLIGLILATGSAFLSAEEERSPDETCLECHSDPDLTMEKDGEEVSLFVDEKKLRASVHAKNQCSECHGGLTAEHPDDEKRSLPVDYSKCHEKQSASFGASVHGMALHSGNDAAAGCVDCHGSHEVFAHGSEKSADDRPAR